MENINENEIITTEAIENLTEATAHDGSALKTIGAVGLGLIAVGAAVKFVVIPVARKVKHAIIVRKKLKDLRNKAKEGEIDIDDIDIDDIPEIDE